MSQNNTQMSQGNAKVAQIRDGYLAQNKNQYTRLIKQDFNTLSNQTTPSASDIKLNGRTMPEMARDYRDLPRTMQEYGYILTVIEKGQ